MTAQKDSLERIQALARANLSFPARMGYVGLLLAATAMVSQLGFHEPLFDH